MKMNALGLPEKETKELVDHLNILLSNFQIHYQNLRGFHWNIKGRRFFDLHLKFEEFYNDSQLKIDLIAERILTLGGIPHHSFEEYLSKSLIKPAKDVSKDEKAIKSIINSLTELLKVERSILELSGDINDEGTNSMMSDFIAEQEKTMWMLNAWLED